MASEPAWVHNDQGERSAAIVNIDNGKYIAVVAVCATISALSAAYAWDAKTQARDTDTNYQVLLNHQTKVESRLEFVEAKLKESEHAKQ